MTTATTPSRYQVRELRDSDEAAVLSLLTASLAGGPTGERTPEFLRWKHKKNPFGSSPGLVALAPDGSLAAVRLFLRWQLRCGSHLLHAVRAVDTATHPDHQGKGLFRRLTLEALDTVASDADLVFNTPNDQSRPGYLKMGWSTVGDVPISIRPVRPIRFVRGARSTGQARVTAPAPSVASGLPQASEVLQSRAAEVAALVVAEEDRAPLDRVRTPRDADYLWWRYGTAPGLDYRAVVVQDAGGIRGLGLGRVRRRGTLSELTLGDILTRDGDPASSRAVLRAAARAGTDYVATHLTAGSPAAASPWRAGYVTVPGRGLTLTTRVQRPLAVDVHQLSNWALSLGDLEVF